MAALDLSSLNALSHKASDLYNKGRAANAAEKFKEAAAVCVTLGLSADDLISATLAVRALRRTRACACAARVRACACAAHTRGGPG